MPGLLSKLDPTKTDDPKITINSDGKNITDFDEMASIVVTKEANRIPRAKIVLVETMEGGKPTVTHSGFFKHGTIISVNGTYSSVPKVAGVLTETLLISGMVVKSSFKSKGDRPPQVILEIQDKAVRTTVGRKMAAFTDMDDEQIITDILSKYGFTAQFGNPLAEAVDALRGNTAAAGGEKKLQETVQFNATDWDFILMRAEKNAKLVIVENSIFYIKSPKIDLLKANTFTYGEDIFEFEAEIDGRSQYPEVTSQSLDKTGEEPVEQKGEEPEVEKELKLAKLLNTLDDGLDTFQSITTGDLSPLKSLFVKNVKNTPESTDLAESLELEPYEQTHGGHVSEEEMQKWSDGAMMKSRLSKVRGRVKVKGQAYYNPGQTITLKGVGNQFSGNFYVTGVSHQVTRQSWETDIIFGMSPNWFGQDDLSVDLPASGLVPPVGGLQIGKVAEIHNDPEGEFRVKVEMPILGKNTDGIWARLATTDGRGESGFFFIPQVGDEVVLGFFNEDPRDPVVLGSMYGKNAEPPFTPTEENTERAIVTPGKLKVTLDDKFGKIILETPDGNLLTLEDGEKNDEGKSKADDGGITLTDKHGNSIEMNKDGVKIVSAAKLDIESAEDLSVSSNANVSVKGNETTVESGATTTVKGTKVAVSGSRIELN